MKQPAITYQIRVEGRLDQRWLEWFDAINIISVLPLLVITPLVLPFLAWRQRNQ